MKSFLTSTQFSLVSIFIFFLLIVPNYSQAQCWNYTFASTTDNTYTALSSPTQLIAGSVDDQRSALTFIGFTFTYNAVDYTEFRAMSNGVVNLGGDYATTASNNGLRSSSRNEMLAPLWDNLKTNSGGSVSYKLIGSSGSYILKIEFKDMGFVDYVTGTSMNFQIWLYEASNKIEFRYGSMGEWTGQSASIGINDETIYQFLSITPAASPTSSSTTSNDAIATNDDLEPGLMYSFTKPSDWYWWQGGTSTNWATPSNWYGAAEPTTSNHVTISKGKTYYPIIDGTEFCNDLGIGEDTKVTVNESADLTVNNDIWIGGGGEFELNDGTVTVSRDFKPGATCIVDINGGTLDITRDFGLSAKGTIELSGGIINVDDDCEFSSSGVTGSMTGTFQLNIADDFRINNNGWNTVEGGTITLTGTDGSAKVYPSNSSHDVIAYNLVINGSGNTFIFTRSTSNTGIIINHDLTFTAGTIETINGLNHTDKFTVANDFTMGSGAHFKDAIESTDYSVGSYSFDAASTYEMYGTTQNIPAATFGHLTVSAAGTKSISGSTTTTVAGNLNVSAGVLSVPETKGLTVTGSTTNTAGTGGIVIESSASGTGSLIVKGTATGDVVMERYIAAATWETWNDGWHFLSSPIANYDIATSNFVVETAADYDFYAWSEPDNLWINFKTGDTPSFETVNGSDDFELGYGYMAAYKDASTKDFTGTINVDNVAIAGLTITGSANHRSWHLLGNPFNSALTWHTGWTPVNIAGTAQIWNEDNQSYSPIVADGIIPATNGFMVQASGGTGTLTIPKANREHNTTAFYKSTEYPIIKLKANNIDNSSAQESQLRFNPESTTGWDLEFDGDFLAGYAPYFYSIVEGVPQSVNSMPNVEETTSIPFTFIKNEGLNFSIEMYEVENMEQDVWLFDNKLNKDHNLTLNPVYIFTAFEQDDPERFILHFSPLDLDENVPSNDIIQLWFANKIIYIHNPEHSTGQIRILNLFGQETFKTKLNGEAKQEIYINTPAAYYIVNIVYEKGVVNKKLYIQ